MDPTWNDKTKGIRLSRIADITVIDREMSETKKQRMRKVQPNLLDILWPGRYEHLRIIEPRTQV